MAIQMAGKVLAEAASPTLKDVSSVAAAAEPRTKEVEQDHNTNRLRNADECMSLHCCDLVGDPG